METLDKMRKGLKAMEEEIELPMDPAFYDRLHDKIMARVEGLEIAPKPRLEGTKKFLKGQWRSWVYPAGSTLALAIVGTLLTLQFSSAGKSSQIQALNQGPTQGTSAVSASSQTEADFIVEVDSVSSHRLNIAQLNKIVIEIRH